MEPSVEPPTNNDKGAQRLNPTGVATQSDTPSRRACDACRGRKVRCDRHNPTCGRCAKFSIACHYSTRSKTAPWKTDLSRFLVALNDRLELAETQLATGGTSQTSKPLMPWAATAVSSSASHSSSGLSRADSSPWTADLSNPQTIDLDSIGIFSDDIMSQHPHLTDWSSSIGSNIDTSGFQFDSFTPAMLADPMLVQPRSDGNQIFDLDAMFPDMPIVPDAMESTMQRFYDRFFETLHPVMPIVSRTRFQAEIAKAAPPIEVQALSYAIGALGALSVPGLDGFVEMCYGQVRSLLDTCERQDSGASLTNINAMQAYVLLTLFELKQPNFARAWMTLGRATRLAKMMGLDKRDGQSGSEAGSGMATPWSGWGLSPFPLVPPSPVDLEERRRGFWLLYILDTFAALRAGVPPAFNKEISVSLPSPTESPDANAGDTMPSLQEVFEISEIPALSAFAGTAIMISLYQRWYHHMLALAQDPVYPFWENYYRISKAISHCQTNLLLQHMTGSSGDDPLSVTMRMNLDTVAIHLHETAFVKAQSDELPAGVASEALAKCSSAAMDIAVAVQLGQRLTGQKLEGFHQLDRFVIWPITTAIQACFRMLDIAETDVAPYISSLRILCGSMKDLVDPEHIAPGLLDKADASVAEAERSTSNKLAQED